MAKINKAVRYFQSFEGKIIGYHSHDLNAKVLPKGVKITKHSCDNPQAFVGADVSCLKSGVPPKVVVSQERKLLNMKNRLRVLKSEIDFLVDVDDIDTTEGVELTLEYEKIKKDYKRLKTTK
jgi:hypothetical protein